MRLKVWLLTLTVVATNVVGNFVLAVAMRNAPASAGVVTSLLQPMAYLGIAILTTWMLLRMRLLGLADLSFVVPVTAFGYVLNALAGVLLLKEHLGVRGWLGTVAIMAGSILTGLTNPEGSAEACPEREAVGQEAEP